MNGKIEIVGLGAGSLEQLPLGIYRKLIKTEIVLLRTEDHPVVKQLINEGVKFQSFDYVYEKHDEFAPVYEEICTTLIKEATEKTIVYAVPGHPLVAEKTVQLLLEKGPAEKVAVEIVGGHSFIDPIFQTLKIDPIEGFQLLDGTALDGDNLQLKQHTIIGQVYDAFVASEVKLTLMEKLPDDYVVYIVTAAGTADEIVKKVPLYELDREIIFSNLTSVYVPPIRNEQLLLKEFTKLRQIIAELRGPNGCPWDKKQTNETLIKYLIEETYEVVEAIEKGDIDNLIEELGDVLLQVMLHAQIGEDEGFFNIDDVIETLSSKMIRRHPHVFSEVTVRDERDVIKTWEQIKATEKGGHNNGAILANINNSAPNLLRAMEIQKRAAKVGFDWDEIEPMLAKVKEEWHEFTEELRTNKSLKNAKREFGDILFALVNVARYLEINPEEALYLTNLKFAERFAYIEEQVKKSNRNFEDFTLDELDEFWERAKRK